jgi:hypothetical protein
MKTIKISTLEKKGKLIKSIANNTQNHMALFLYRENYYIVKYNTYTVEYGRKLENGTIDGWY